MSPEQSKLMRRAQRRVKAAQELLTLGFYDFAISRAYYAMFYVAKAIILTENISSNKHSGVISAFGQHFAKTGRVPAEFHQYLNHGQEQRTLSDYDMDVTPTREAAELQLERAEKFIEMGEKFFNSPPTTTSSEPDER